jgi:hypothetical protein
MPCSRSASSNSLSVAIPVQGSSSCFRADLERCAWLPRHQWLRALIGLVIHAFAGTSLTPLHPASPPLAFAVVPSGPAGLRCRPFDTMLADLVRHGRVQGPQSRLNGSIRGRQRALR